MILAAARILNYPPLMLLNPQPDPNRLGVRHHEPFHGAQGEAIEASPCGAILVGEVRSILDARRGLDGLAWRLSV